MRMGYQLTLEQQQKLVMTPELKLALKILQLPSTELEQLIQNEMEVNPILDLKENKEIKEDIASTNNKSENDLQKDIDWKEYIQFQGKSHYIDNNAVNDDSELSYDNIIAYRNTLKDNLYFQLNVSSINNELRDIGEFLINSIDDNGYLTISTYEISKILNEDEHKINKVLEVIQSFEPIGVGSRDLSECLIIQLKQKDMYNNTLGEIIQNHIEDLANNRLGIISKKLSISIEKVQQLCDIIKNLEPKPGRAFDGSDEIRYIKPDVFIEKIRGEYIITVNEYYSSKLTINRHYRSILKSEDKSSQAFSYINNKLSSALWLIRSIEHRKNTLYNVMKAILQYQLDFFEFGVMYLKTMTLRNIADIVEVHESTVSRAINGKYVQTPKGVFEIKYFFKSGIGNTDGEAISSESIKGIIKHLIHNEKATNPLSDQNIADILTKRGYKISRRTVAKYRDEIGILSSSKRKRY